MGWDTATTWHRLSGGGWQHKVHAGCRVERSEASDPSSPGPTSDGSTRVFFFRDPGLAPGDALSVGVVADAEPPESALEVRSVTPWSVRHAHHHTEVVAR